MGRSPAVVEHALVWVAGAVIVSFLVLGYILIVNGALDHLHEELTGSQFNQNDDPDGG